MSVKPISDTLRLLHGGLFLDECSHTLADAVKAVDETGKPAKVTITLELKKVHGALSVSSNVTSKTPEPKPDADMFWPTVEGNLSQQNPNQRSLDLRSVDTDAGEIRMVDLPQASAARPVAAAG
jgi:hypothetical protein